LEAVQYICTLPGGDFRLLTNLCYNAVEIVTTYILDPNKEHALTTKKKSKNERKKKTLLGMT
jgi:hypothetical protein